MSTALIRLLIRAGHDVQTPSVAGISGGDDPVHLLQAARDDRVLLSHNHDDFKNLHDLVTQTGGAHPGIFVIRRENNPRRDMDAGNIARAIGNLISANFPLKNQFVILNQWR